jgi:hypothetical protein
MAQYHFLGYGHGAARHYRVCRACVALHRLFYVVHVTKVHVCIEGLSCSSEKTDIAAKFSMFCAPNTSFHILILFSRENPAQGYRHQYVRGTLCTSAPQGANHFCGPSDLLSPTTTCFSKLITYIVWGSSCGQNLIQNATHRCPAASTVCATCTFRIAQKQFAQNWP